MSLYVLISIFILSGILMFLKHRKTFYRNFYHTQTDAQLKKEAKKLLFNILGSIDENSKFIYPNFKSVDHLKSDIKTLIYKVDDTTLKGHPNLSSINRPDLYFNELASINNWSEYKIKWIKELSLIFTEISIRQGLLPKD